MSSMELSLDVAEPVIDIKGLSGVAENRGMKPDEVIQRHHLITLLGGVLSNDTQQLMRVPSVPFDLHLNPSHRGWRWKIAFHRFIPTTLGMTKLGTGSLRHPKGLDQCK